MSRRVFVDANVPMYAGGAASPQKSACLGFMRKVAEGRIGGTSSSAILQEILHRYLHLKRPELARRVFDGFRAVIPTMYAVEAEDLDEARRLMNAYPRANTRDLVHLAVMIRRSIRTIVSYDSDFDAFKEVTRLTPDQL